MGILDVHLSGIEQTKEETYSIYGDNMTANSKVFVNGDKQTTKFYNDAHIELREIALEEGDVVWVVGEKEDVYHLLDKK